jgi:hypothetical protein
MPPAGKKKEGSPPSREAAVSHRAVDKVVQQRLAQATEALDHKLNAGEPEKMILENTDAIDDFFMEALRSERIGANRRQHRTIRQITKGVDIIQKLSQPPAEYALGRRALSAEDQASASKLWKPTRNPSTRTSFKF